jgi:hypothetical protein
MGFRRFYPSQEGALCRYADRAYGRVVGLRLLTLKEPDRRDRRLLRPCQQRSKRGCDRRAPSPATNSRVAFSYASVPL